MNKIMIIINIVLTILVLSLAHDLYIYSTPISIEFNVTNLTPSRYVLLETFFQKEFRKKFKSRYKNITNIKENGKISYNLNGLYIHELKFQFRAGDDFCFDVTDFKVNGEVQETFLNATKDNPIAHVTKDNAVFINDCAAFSKLVFNWKIAVIVACIAFAVFNVLLKYLVKLKLENKSENGVINIIFVVACLVFFFIPMIKINKKDVSKEEKRHLADYKPFWSNGKINNNYGKDLESYFNDRFLGRHSFISRYDDIMFFINQKNLSNIEGKDGWFFYNSHNFDGYAAYQNSKNISEEECKQFAKYIINWSNYCKANNIKFYLAIHPNKSKVYGEYFAPDIKKLKPDSESYTAKVIHYLQKNSDVNVIYTLDAVVAQKNKNGHLYYTDDTHWTDLGTYYAYRAMVKEILKSFPDFKMVEYDSLVQTQKSVRGDVLPKKAPMNNYVYTVPKFNYNKDVKIINDVNDIVSVYNSTHVVATNPTKDLKVLFYRDSFSSLFANLFAESCGKVEMFWRYNLEIEDLEKMKEYDIVILSIVERFLPNLKMYEVPKESK